METSGVPAQRVISDQMVDDTAELHRAPADAIHAIGTSLSEEIP